MKKILCGVLAAASLLSMTVSASAATNEKAVKAAGEVEYDVEVTAPKVTLDLIMPAKMTAQLNPYNAEIILRAEDTANSITEVKINSGIASVAYAITNNSVDYGIYIDATATTTVSGKDWSVKKTAPVDGTKTAQMALVGGNTEDDIATAAAAIPTANAAFADPDQGVLMMDSTVVADKTKGIAAGQTTQKKFMFIAAAAPAVAPATTATPTKGYMAFVGALANSDEANDKEVEWTEDDSINVALVLKVVAGPKGAPAGGGGGASFTNPAGLSGALSAGTGVSNLTRTGDSSYTATFSKAALGSATPVTTAFTIPLDTGVTIDAMSGVVSTNTNAVAASGSNLMVGGLSSPGDTTTLTIKLSNNTEITVVVTIAA